MLSRRNLRVKVMQVVYAIEHSNSVNPEQAVRMLEKSIEKSYNLLVFNLSLIVRIADHIRKKAGIKTSKLLPTDQDLQFSTKLADNPFIHILRSDKKVSDRLRLTMTEDEEMLIEVFFKKMIEESEYKDYCANGDGSKEKEIILFIFNTVIHKNPAYTLYVEDNFSECMSEAGKINSGIEEILNKISAEDQNKPLEFPDSSGEEKFAKELLEKTMANNDHYTELIKPRLKNWDLDRIAHIDMILMKLALCELLCFEQIPVKVSINEYIDISKTYSTPRSKDFINGILDNIMHELRESKEIKKTGRGLVE